MAREDILDQAERLFAENGYAAASMADLATAVGLRKASLYSHFHSKADLYFAVIDRAHRRFRNEIQALLGQKLPPEEHLRRQMREICSQGPVNRFRFTLFPPKDLIGRAAPAFSDFDSHFRMVVSGVLRAHLGDDVPAERVAALVGMYLYLMNGLLSIENFVSKTELADRVDVTFPLFWELVEKSDGAKKGNGEK